MILLTNLNIFLFKFLYKNLTLSEYLQKRNVCRRIIVTATWPSGKAEACKAFIPQFESGCRLFLLPKITNYNLSRIYGYNGVKSILGAT